MTTLALQRIHPSMLPSVHGIACFVDVETTGLSPQNDEVIEVALVLFAFDRSDGTIIGILDEYVGQREPTIPIPGAATAVHGLTKAELRGKKLDYARVEALIHHAEFLVAHNASFDRGFLSRLSPTAAEKPWFCSMRGIKWEKRGFTSRKLQHLLAAHHIDPGSAHRAGDDVASTLQLLAMHDHADGPYFRELLASAPIRPRKVTPHKQPGRARRTPSQAAAAKQPAKGAGCAAAAIAMLLLVAAVWALLS